MRKVENVMEYFGQAGLHPACLLAYTRGLIGNRSASLCREAFNA
jgi:hypothetical protein